MITHTERPLSVVIPAYNEEKTVEQVVRKVLEVNLVGEVIVVNDCSRDKTSEIVQAIQREEPRLKLVEHEINQGKGAALRTGFKEATLSYVIVQDADLEYDPEEFPLVLEPLIAGKCDVCYGSRYLKKHQRRVLKFWHTRGNRFLTTLSNFATHLYLTDMETCYKAFKREVIQRSNIEENRFGFEPEVTAKIAQRHIPVYEVSISYYPRSFAEGKHIGWKDGFRAIWCILKYGILRRNKSHVVESDQESKSLQPEA